MAEESISSDHWLRSRPIAHRGLHNLSNTIPENSLAAFELACSKHIPIEIDVRISKDGEAVVFHDSNILRITGINLKIDKLISKELTRFNILSTDEHIPLLKEALDQIGGRVPVLIDIKNFFLPGRTENIVLNVLKSYKGEFAIESFNPWSVGYMRRNFPEYITGLIIGKTERFLLQAPYTNSLINKIASPQFISYNLSGRHAMSSFTSYFKRLNLPIIAWTVKSTEDEKKARKFADNIIFENYLPL